LISRSPIPYGRQSISDADIENVVQVLRGDWLTQGPSINEFEKSLADYCGAKYAIAVSSGTAALHLAAIALKVGPGQEVITSPITFAATSNAVIYAGGVPVFCDIQADSLVIDNDQIKIKLASSEAVTGLIPVHMGGALPDMEGLSEIARNKGLWIIEDACHSIGGTWQDSKGVTHKIGDCSHSDITVFSFHPVKHITTGEGGAILTNDKNLYEQIMELRTHGITKDPSKLIENHGGWYYEMQQLGYNYRITDFQAALGQSQLARSDEWVGRRLELVQTYDEAFKDCSHVKHQQHTKENRLCYHLYIIRVQKRKVLYEYLRSVQIFTQVHYIPVHLQPYYREKYGYEGGEFPVAEKYYEEALSLPLYPSLTDKEQKFVIFSVLEYFESK
jgi:UDP-4-amino-4,6-dideoxy-N-acetyl-beta-L-altrosamine transaminase